MDDEVTLRVADEYQDPLAQAILKALRDTQTEANIAAFQREYAKGNYIGAAKALGVFETLTERLTDG